MNSLIKKHEDGTIELTVTLPWALIEKTKNTVLENHVKVAELPGFRKGMAPRDIVEKNLDKDHIREDILRTLLPQSYADAIKEQKIMPVINPKIRVESIEEGKEWTFTAITAEAPSIKLGDYKEAVKKITAKAKIILPGKEPTTVTFEEISAALLQTATIQIPGVIIDQEVERLLAQTLDEVKRLGLTLDQYLASTGRNIDSLKQEYALKAENDIKIEFLLQKIAESEGIKVEDKEVEEAIAQGKTEAEKQNLQTNKILLKSIIRQQKTLDFLRNL